MRFILVFTLISISFLANGQQTQEVHGTVQDTAGINLAGVNVRLISETDTLLTSTDNNGQFTFFQVKSSEFHLSFTLLGFQLQDYFYKIQPFRAENQLISVILRPQRNILREVVVFAVPIVIKEDTIQYNSAAYKVAKGAFLEELLKKLPGIEVDRSGNVKAQGSLVTRVKVNGKDFFGGDVLTATRNLPAEIVENIQVIDDYGDQANFTGIKRSSPDKIINISIKEDRNQGMFGQLTTGIGTDYRYLGSASANSFNNDRQLSVIGSINNTNSSLFSFGDVSGAGGRESSASDLSNMIELDDGINRTNSLGFNFRDNLSPKVTTYGGYAYTNRKNNTEGSTNLASIFQNNTITTEENRELEIDNGKHNLAWNFESNLNNQSYFKISPTLSFISTNSLSTSTSLINNRYLNTNRFLNSEDEASSPNGEIDMFFNYRFKKAGRRFSINVQGNIFEDKRNNRIDEDRKDIDSSFTQPVIRDEQLNQRLSNDQNTSDVHILGSYIEPINKNSFVELNYEHNYSSNRNNRETINTGNYDSNELIVDSTYMNYAYQFQSDQIGFNYQYNDNQTTYTIGFGLQPTNITGYTLNREISTNKKFINFVPSARFSFKINNFSSFSISYRGKNNQPGFSQIQPIRDLSNSQNLIIGNPKLESEFINNISLQFRNFNYKSGNTFFGNLSFQNIKNKIVTNRVSIANTTRQETNFLNTSGYFDANAYYLYSLSLIEQIFDVNISGSANYNNNISFINFQKNSGRYLVYTQGAQISYNPDDWLDLDLKGSFTLNQTRNTLPSIINNDAYTWVFGLGGKTYLGKWAFSFDISQRTNNGFSDFVNRNPTLLNVYLERTFLKNNRGALRIQGYDLFNENTGITHEVYGNDIYQTRNNRLARYFLISFNFRLQKFPTIKE